MHNLIQIIVPGKITIGDLTVLALFMASQYFKIENDFNSLVPSAQPEQLRKVCKSNPSFYLVIDFDRLTELFLILKPSVRL